jgi:sialic acid synthase
VRARKDGMGRRELFIGGQRIADDTDAYFIAEVGHNHAGRLEVAEELFRAAAKAGASAVKLQKRDNQSLFTKAMYDEPYTGRNSYGATYGAHREALEFGPEQYTVLAALAAELGMGFMASAFDLPSVDFLAGIGVSAIKIASGDLASTPLLAYAAQVGVPLVVSTGGADLRDVRRACDTVLPVNPRLALLQCTAVYPARAEQLNLSVIGTYRAEFPSVVVGFSGHDAGLEHSLTAYALGARVIEKHVTLDHTAAGTDHHFSLEPDEAAELIRGLHRVRQALGDPVKRRLTAETPALRKMGKKLVAARDLPAGHRLGAADIAMKSPGDGLPPYRLPDAVGRVTARAVPKDGDILPEALR